MFKMDKHLKNELTFLVLLSIFFLTIGLSIVSTCKAESFAETAIEKVKTPSDWMSRKSLKWGFIGVAVGTNMLRMLSEADQFDNRDLLSPGTHHAVDAGIITGLLATGFLAYAVMERDTWTWKEKAALFAGTGMACWECGDGIYKYKRWNNWWDNNPAHNQNNIPWYDYKNGFRDAFKGTGRVSTMLLHAGRTGSAMYFIGTVH